MSTFVTNKYSMNKMVYLCFVVLLISCSTTKNITPPMTEKMFQSSKKNYLKKYTKNFINSIPKEDYSLITKDTIIIVYDTISHSN